MGVPSAVESLHHLDIVNLGVLGYSEGYRLQQQHHGEVLALRETGGGKLGRVLLVEHHPVITVTRRPDAPGHVVASDSQLASAGVEVHQTDRGGDVTYHGPGQLVCYPIIDLHASKLRIHAYLRALEGAVIGTMGHFGIACGRDPDATGVWTNPSDGEPAKICAMGVRVRRWITMHGLAINVRTNLDHFGLIVPCGLQRPVTSMRNELGESACPAMNDVQHELCRQLDAHLSGSVEGKS